MGDHASVRGPDHPGEFGHQMLMHRGQFVVPPLLWYARQPQQVSDSLQFIGHRMQPEPPRPPGKGIRGEHCETRLGQPVGKSLPALEGLPVGAAGFFPGHHPGGPDRFDPGV